MKKLSYMTKSIPMKLLSIEGRIMLILIIKALPFLRRMVEGIPELKSTHEGICKGCALAKEAFSGKKPNVENLRIFGCLVYSHIPKNKRNKLEHSGKKGIFVGYSDSYKAYRIYIPEQHKIKVSRDVTFNEKMAFKKSIEETVEEQEIEEPNDESTENEK
jgi:hypothetical protein